MMEYLRLREAQEAIAVAMEKTIPEGGATLDLAVSWKARSPWEHQPMLIKLLRIWIDRAVWNLS